MLIFQTLSQFAQAMTPTTQKLRLMHTHTHQTYTCILLSNNEICGWTSALYYYATLLHRMAPGFRTIRDFRCSPPPHAAVKHCQLKIYPSANPKGAYTGYASITSTLGKGRKCAHQTQHPSPPPSPVLAVAPSPQRRKCVTQNIVIL